MVAAPTHAIDTIAKHSVDSMVAAGFLILQHFTVLRFFPIVPRAWTFFM